jgi:putative transposase
MWSEEETMNLHVNMLIEWIGEGTESRIERVLWIDPTGEHVAVIDILNRTALPVLCESDMIQDALDAMEARILTIDPYAIQHRPEEDIPIQHREIRDRAWESIAPLVEIPNTTFFSPRTRGWLIAKAAEQAGCSEPTIYKRLRLYWQRGQTRNALLPDLGRCGGKGKERIKQTDPQDARKRGRPSALAKAGEESPGINVTHDVRERLQRGGRLFYESRQGISLPQAYQRTLEKFFNVGFRWEEGVRVPILPPVNELPSFGQFRYWYGKDREPQRILVAREGQRRFESNYRPVLGDSRQMAFGPGSLYQIDATPSDIHLVSSLDRSRIIGRPTTYLVVDVFSGLITGLNVSLEAASWLAAMLALENAATDKVSFCEQYGTVIMEDEWPSCHLPEAILADRGELEGYNADNLVNALGIRVHNTPPYRGDLKGIVERHFRTANDELIGDLPGRIRQFRDRGEIDYRLEACLTLGEFIKLLIYHVLDYNAYHRMTGYPLDAEMIADHVEPYPLDLWHWGVQNRVGHLRATLPDIVRLNLLPQGTASVTRRGILFQGLLYVCNLAVEEQWFVRARERGRWRIPVAYDPRKTDVLYLRLDEGRRLERCELLPKEGAFHGRDWQETLDCFARRKVEEERARTQEQQAQARRHAHQVQIVDQAMEKTREAVADMNKSARLHGIRENRKAERDRERETNAWDLTSELTCGHSLAEKPEDQTDEQPYVPPPQDLDSLRKLREERLKNE